MANRDYLIAKLGDGFEVCRAPSSEKRQMVGPFIFFDQTGPAQFLAGLGLKLVVVPDAVFLASEDISYVTAKLGQLYPGRLGTRQVCQPIPRHSDGFHCFPMAVNDKVPAEIVVPSLKAAESFGGSLRDAMMLRLLTVSRNLSAAGGGKEHTYRFQALQRAKPRLHQYETSP